MTRFWFDTEFIEDGRTIDLISIGIVSEDNRKYYAVSSECDPTKASKWVRKNIGKCSVKKRRKRKTDLLGGKVRLGKSLSVSSYNFPC